MKNPRNIAASANIKGIIDKPPKFICMFKKVKFCLIEVHHPKFLPSINPKTRKNNPSPEKTVPNQSNVPPRYPFASLIKTEPKIAIRAITTLMRKDQRHE